MQWVLRLIIVGRVSYASVHFAAVTQVEHDARSETALEWDDPLFRQASAQLEAAVSYFEWVQDLGRLFWDREEIRRRLADKLGDAFDRVWELAAQKEITLRDAALLAAVDEVGAALEARGLFP